MISPTYLVLGSALIAALVNLHRPIRRVQRNIKRMLYNALKVHRHPNLLQRALRLARHLGRIVQDKRPRQIVKLHRHIAMRRLLTLIGGWGWPAVRLDYI